MCWNINITNLYLWSSFVAYQIYVCTCFLGMILFVSRINITVLCMGSFHLLGIFYNVWRKMVWSIKLENLGKFDLMQGCCRWGAWDITSSLEPLLTQSRTNESVVMAVKTTHTGHLIEFFRRERHSDHCVNNNSMAMDRNKKHVRRRNGVTFLWQCFPCCYAGSIGCVAFAAWNLRCKHEPSRCCVYRIYNTVIHCCTQTKLILKLIADWNSVLLFE